MIVRSMLPPSMNLSARQESVRRRARGRSLRGAVRMAASSFFRFTHRDSRGDALWSDKEHVWLGKKTFYHWALYDPEIDIPRAIATAADAPEAPEALREVVQAELTVYWQETLANLPRRERPSWLPLP